MSHTGNTPVTLELTLEEVNKIAVWMSEFPLKDTIALYTKIKVQTESQLQPQGESHE